MTQAFGPHRIEDVNLDMNTATRLVRRYVQADLSVVGVKPLNGGMAHRVLELRTDGQPDAVVAKITALADDPGFGVEAGGLIFCREHTRFPVPKVYACTSGEDGFAGTCILMQRIPGPNLQSARVSPAGRHALQIQLAQHLAHLHSIRRTTYGSAATDHHHPRWLDRFGPTMTHQFQLVREQLSTQCRRVIEYLLTHLEEWLPETHDPRLVHGDLWATNILVDDRHPDRPEVLAFIDGDMDFADPEYELAYLRLFQTAGQAFFDVYHQQHPRRSGFDRRCRVYWLNTMMLNVSRFGARHLASVEDLAEQVRRLI
jgi:fructosamine-3-kinase